MPATTTITAVQKIIQYDDTVITDIQPFIDSAILIVTAVVGTALPDPGLELIVRYLSAHLISITDSSTRVQSEQIKSLQNSYQYRLSDGLGITHWGATAMMLDTSGKLANWNRKVIDGVAGAFTLVWGGKPPEQSPAYNS